MRTVEDIITIMEEKIKQYEMEITRLSQKYKTSDEHDQCYISEDIEILKHKLKVIKSQLAWIKGS